MRFMESFLAILCCPEACGVCAISEGCLLRVKPVTFNPLADLPFNPLADLPFNPLADLPFNPLADLPFNPLD
jgi:hypothetical protein